MQKYNSRLGCASVVIIGLLVLLSSLPAVAVGFSPFLPPIARGRGLWKKLGPRSSKIEAESKLGVVSRRDSGITCDLRELGGQGKGFQNAIDVTTEWASRGIRPTPSSSRMLEVELRL